MNDREKRIQIEKRRLTKSYKSLTGHRQVLAESLIDRASQQRIMLEDLEGAIAVNGMVEDYNNGQHQSGRKQSAEMASYTSLTKQHLATTKQLDDLLKAEPDKPAEDKLAAFMMSKPKLPV